MKLSKKHIAHVRRYIYVRQLRRETQQRRNRQLSFKLLRAAGCKQKAHARQEKHISQLPSRRELGRRCIYISPNRVLAERRAKAKASNSREYGIKLKAIFASSAAAERASEHGQRDGFQSERVYLLARFVYKISSAACELWIFHPSTAGAATLKTFVFAQPVENFFLSIARAFSLHLLQVERWECLIFAFYSHLPVFFILILALAYVLKA